MRRIFGFADVQARAIPEVQDGPLLISSAHGFAVEDAACREVGLAGLNSLAGRPRTIGIADAMPEQHCRGTALNGSRGRVSDTMTPGVAAGHVRPRTRRRERHHLVDVPDDRPAAR